jgi:hypothetical protein
MFHKGQFPKYVTWQKWRISDNSQQQDTLPLCRPIYSYPTLPRCGLLQSKTDVLVYTLFLTDVSCKLDKNKSYQMVAITAGTGLAKGSKVTFKCNRGCGLTNMKNTPSSTTLTCMSDGTWSGSSLNCVHDVGPYTPTNAVSKY